jgi:hypothetical protein
MRIIHPAFFTRAHWTGVDARNTSSGEIIVYLPWRSHKISVGKITKLCHFTPDAKGDKSHRRRLPMGVKLNNKEGGDVPIKVPGRIEGS